MIILKSPIDELAELNLEAKARRASHSISADEIQEERIRYLTDETRIKAVTVCFSDLEGRFHMLDYDKKFLLKSHDNLTFDGSSVQGFAVVNESDLRLGIDWGSFRWLPSDIFGPGKVIVFGLIQDAEGVSYSSDMRGRLKNYSDELYKQGLVANVAVECEGFVFNGLNAERSYTTSEGFELVSNGGYYNSLPNDPLRQFIDRLAEALPVDEQRLVVTGRNDALVVGEGAVDQLGGEDHRTEREADLRVRKLHRRLHVRRVDQFLQLADGLARDDDARHPRMRPHVPLHEERHRQDGRRRRGARARPDRPEARRFARTRSAPSRR